MRAQQPGADNLVKQGITAYETGDFMGAISTWQRALDYIDADNLSHRSIVLENLARAHRQTGQFSDEIGYWQQVTQQYETLGELQALGRAFTEQAQAHNHLGQHRRALALLCGESISHCNQNSALHLAQALQDISGEAAALASLGETYRLTGHYDQAVVALNQSLAVLDEENLANATGTLIAVLNSLGNTYGAQAQVNRRRGQAAKNQGDRQTAEDLTQRAREQTQQAVDLLRQSYGTAQSGQRVAAQLRSLLNLIPLYQTLDRTIEVTQAKRTAQDLIHRLPNSQEKVFSMLTLAGYLDPGSTPQCPATAQTQLLEDAIAIATTLQNSRAESFGLGQLGNLYEHCGDYDQALELTQTAQLVADQDRASQDSVYLWAWQQGRILKAQGHSAAAAVAYTQALDSLESLRSDLLNANQELQFDFRDRVEPIYREFAALTLDQLPPSTPIAKNQSTVDTVLSTLDSLKLAELQNYFANDCVITPNATRVDAVGAQQATAVISTVILPDRTAVIASFPNGQQQLEWIPLGEEQMVAVANELRFTLEESRRFTQVNVYKASSKQLYDQLIRPFEETLNQLQVTELVFINDGILRGLPMATLYDGQRFLIEKYAIATTPSLTLTDPNALDRKNLNALILGLSEASYVDNQFFPALNEVEGEVETVKAKFPKSKVLKNQAFSQENLRQAFKGESFRILHIATHGSFGAEPKDNFIVTGQKVDERNHKALTISELDALIRSVSAVGQEPIDLLTLTACETAIGDSRAILGLAGVAVRAGVRSAIASLWAVNDEATADLITRFYNHLLDPNLTKAEALRKAQLEMIHADGYTKRPYYWAPFILIGNWL